MKNYKQLQRGQRTLKGLDYAQSVPEVRTRSTEALPDPINASNLPLWVLVMHKRMISPPLLTADNNNEFFLNHLVQQLHFKKKKNQSTFFQSAILSFPLSFPCPCLSFLSVCHCEATPLWASTPLQTRLTPWVIFFGPQGEVSKALFVYVCVCACVCVLACVCVCSCLLWSRDT